MTATTVFFSKTTFLLLFFVFCFPPFFFPLVFCFFFFFFLHFHVSRRHSREKIIKVERKKQRANTTHFIFFSFLFFASKARHTPQHPFSSSSSLVRIFLSVPHYSMSFSFNIHQSKSFEGFIFAILEERGARRGTTGWGGRRDLRERESGVCFLFCLSFVFFKFDFFLTPATTFFCNDFFSSFSFWTKKKKTSRRLFRFVYYTNRK